MENKVIIRLPEERMGFGGVVSKCLRTKGMEKRGSEEMELV